MPKTIKATEFWAVKDRSKVAHIIIKNCSFARCGHYISISELRSAEKPAGTRSCKNCVAQHLRVLASIKGR